MKRCGKCGESKPLDAFNRHKQKPDGLRSHCKACMKAYRAANRERIAECDRAYRSKNREAIAEYNRAYKQANRAVIAEHQRGYRATNRDAIVERKRAYRRANPHIGWEDSYRRRVRRFGFKPVVESFTRADLVARYGDQCCHCGGPFEELDPLPDPGQSGRIAHARQYAPVLRTL